MKLNETFDDAVNYTKKSEGNKSIANFDFKPELDIEIEVDISEIGNAVVMVNFFAFGPDKEKQDKGQTTYKIFSTITQIIQDHVEEYNIEKISTIATNDKKADIYEKLLNRFGNGWEVYRQGTDVKAVKNN